jgi:glutathione peroxidase
MKRIWNLLTLPFVALMAACASSAERPVQTTSTTNTMSIYSIPVNDLEGKPIDLSAFKGKKMLIVNTASHCGFTGQYEDLQKLHELHGDKIAVLGFPSNDFGRQEPGNAQEIRSFCTKNYGVSFTMFEKVVVKGKDKAPLYQWLSDKSKNGWNDQEPAWNFSKYLIDENGNLLAFYPSSVNPLDEKILSHLK